jgi:hypothetical protein
MNCPEIVYTVGQQIAGNTLLSVSVAVVVGLVAYLGWIAELNER